jgi:predicted TIM-barrel fold metal-dependent hydrolase
VTAAAETGDIQVIDTDTHVSEPVDLWTSRVPRQVVDSVPHVEVNPATGESCWRIGSTWLSAPGYYSTAGRPDYDKTSVDLEEVDPGSWQAPERLQRMDEYGVYAQLLYPNIIGFESKLIIDLGPELALLCTQVYNDFMTEFASADPDRLLPVAMLPFWDIEASLAEMKRCRENGHRGILFANKYERIGYPSFTDKHWDPIYAAALDLDMSINFHVGFGWSRGREIGQELKAEAREVERTQELASPESDETARDLMRRGVMIPVLSQLTNQDTITAFLLSDLPHRFPNLPFVSVESGFGFVPYLLESLDWHFKGAGMQRYQTELPSEIFRRQCYGTFWFERTTLPLLELYPDNFMFSTDYPHPTSLSPGPASPADLPSEHISAAFRGISAEVARKALHDNAARIYHI